jgi:hypothetical protein
VASNLVIHTLCIILTLWSDMSAGLTSAVVYVQANRPIGAPPPRAVLASAAAGHPCPVISEARYAKL